MFGGLFMQISINKYPFLQTLGRSSASPSEECAYMSTDSPKVEMEKIYQKIPVLLGLASFFLGYFNKGRTM